MDIGHNILELVLEWPSNMESKTIVIFKTPENQAYKKNERGVC
jgi:hypothetical protein